MTPYKNDNDEEITSVWDDPEDEARDEFLLKLQLLSARQILDMKDKQQFIVGEKLLPKSGKMLLTGRTGTGKSIFALHMAAAFATGTPLFNLFDKHKGANYGKPIFPVIAPQTVLYLDYEIPHAIRADIRLGPMAKFFPEALLLNNLHFANHPTAFRLQSQDGGEFKRLARFVRALSPDVLIIDPLSSAHSVNENSSEMKQVLNAADELIDRCGCAVILVHHASSKVQRDAKNNEVQKAAIEEGRGHSSLGDWADVMFHLRDTAGKSEELRDEDSDESTTPGLIEMTCGKSRHRRKPGQRYFSVNFETMEIVQKRKPSSSEDDKADSLPMPTAIVRTDESADDKSELDKAKSLILELQEQGASDADISASAKSAGISSRTLRRARQQLRQGTDTDSVQARIATIVAETPGLDDCTVMRFIERLAEKGLTVSFAEAEKFLRKEDGGQDVAKEVANV